MESVILVDEHDKMLGTMEMMAVHRLGKLHRAFSVFIFNGAGELLLQQRAFEKYHSAGKWSNACCSHPRPGEFNVEAASRRLKEEMGIACELVPGFSFVYKAVFGELTEYEFDHVLFGTTEQIPVPDPLEVAAWQYVLPDVLKKELEQEPDKFTAWFKICFDRVMQYHYQQQENDQNHS